MSPSFYARCISEQLLPHPHPKNCAVEGRFSRRDPPKVGGIDQLGLVDPARIPLTWRDAVVRGQAAEERKRTEVPRPAAASQRSQAVKDRNQAQVGALMRTTAKKDQDADRDETTAERSAWLNGQRRAIVQVLVDAAATKLTSSLGAKLGKVVAAQKQQILESARHAVQVKINQSQHGGESADLQADTLIGESDAWSDAAAVSTEQAKTLVDTKRGALDAAPTARSRSSRVPRSRRAIGRTPVRDGDGRGQEADRPKAKLVEVELTTEANKDTTKKQVVGAAKKSARGAAIKGVQSEIDERHDHHTEVENAVKVPVDEGAERIRAEHENLSREGRRRARHGLVPVGSVRSVHAKMKEAAREKGHARTDDAIGDQRDQRKSGGGGEKKAAFEYQTMQAHVLTHDAAKMELREVMKNFAGELLASTEKTVHPDVPQGRGNPGGVGKAAQRSEPRRRRESPRPRR